MNKCLCIVIALIISLCLVGCRQNNDNTFYNTNSISTVNSKSVPSDASSNVLNSSQQNQKKQFYTNENSASSDEYNTKDYDNAEDFYEDNYSDFDNYDDAEDYYNENSN